jgi:hypothetical protein
MDGGTHDLSGTKIMTVDVHGCTNALKVGCLREAILNIVIFSHPCDHDIAYMDVGT